MPRPEKIRIVEDTKKRLSDSIITIVADYRGMSVTSINALRNKLREGKNDCKVIKNTFVRIACKQCDISVKEDLLKGPSVYVFSKSDPVFPAKVLSEFAKKEQALKIKGGVLDKKEISADDIKKLAKLPSREQLIGQLANVLNAPIQGLVNVLVAPVRNLAYALEAVRKQKESNN